MDEDPAFYKKFSEMLKETIRDYEANRINEAEYLNKVKEIMEDVLSHTDTDIPSSLINTDVGKRPFMGLPRKNYKISSFDKVSRQQVSGQYGIGYRWK